jgi:hypothetical protein
MEAGTIFLRDPIQPFYGLPSEESVARTRANRWLLRDDTDYGARGYFPGRQIDCWRNTTCYPRRFVPSEIIVRPPDDLGNEVKEETFVQAKIYSGNLQ